jgi:hypothetical protein
MKVDELKKFEIDMPTTGTVGTPGEPDFRRFTVTARVIPTKNYDALLEMIQNKIDDAYSRGLEAGGSEY